MMSAQEVQQEVMKAIATLRSHALEIQSLHPAKQSISFDASEWARWFDGTYFERHPACHVLAESAGAFTRAELFRLSEQALEGGHDPLDIQRLWLAIYAWGGGRGAMGYRARVNARLALFDVRFNQSVESVVHSLALNDVAGAHHAIDPVIGAGEGFFTKFLYFLSKPGMCRPLPLIYDEQVRRALQALLGPRWALPLGATMKSSPADIYALYVRTMHEWANQLECSPEQLELFLFQKRGNVAA
jgi:hypothetical protein